MKSLYSILIQWSEEDQCYVVSIPEFTDYYQPVTHGENYEEALKNAQEVLAMILQDNLELPAPNFFSTKS
ncbi:MAG: type II toxin-antitoxin system HicB family antitoxin [Cyanobacteria bacterium P01_F01_bin.143]